MIRKIQRHSFRILLKLGREIDSFSGKMKEMNKVLTKNKEYMAHKAHYYHNSEHSVHVTGAGLANEALDLGFSLWDKDNQHLTLRTRCFNLIV